jgi:hypothetical protein
MSISADYSKALEDAAVSALRDVLANRPSTSIADLRELVSSHPHLGELTLTTLFGQGAAPAKAAKPKAAKAPAKPAAPAKAAAPAAAPTAKKAARASRDQWDTRTASGRAALDQAVLEGLTALGGQDVSAEQLRDRIGATPHQLRTSLARHIEAGFVSYTGKARGTRYSLE